MQFKLNKNTSTTAPAYSLGEEILNAGSHAIGAALAVFAFFLLIDRYSPTPKNYFCITVYCASLFCLYAVSTAYHCLPRGKAKDILRKLDHCSIFLLISGTYAPICLMLMDGLMSRLVLCLVYLAAVCGIILNAINVNKFSKFSMICYLAMGWSVILIAKPAINHLNWEQIFWLVEGGVFYTVGAAIYLIGKKVQYMHSVWHIFVLFGSICHFITLYIL